MKAIVTGGAGFIGSNLTRRLLNDGHEVHVVDDVSLGDRRNVDDRATFHQGTILDGDLLASVFGAGDVVFHQAALPSVPRSIAQPLASHEVNATGTLNVLECARQCGVDKVVLASSSSVYGDSQVSPKHEELVPAPKSPYAVTKLAAEHYARVYHQLHGLRTTCLRYFNVFGPFQNPRGGYAAAVPRFIRAAMQGKDITIFGDGQQSRDFTYVDNVVAANLLAAQSTKSDGQALNVGGGQATTLNELTAAILELTDSQSRIVHEKDRMGDVKHSLSAIEAAAQAMGYVPYVKTNEGLKHTVEWTVENRDWYE